MTTALLSDTDAVRFCTGCSLTVFNLTNMTAPEAEELLKSKSATGEKLCAGIYRREDGTVLTENCPQGLRRLRDGIRKTISRQDPALSSNIAKSYAAFLRKRQCETVKLEKDYKIK